MNQIIQHLKNRNHFLVVTHTGPDGDAIGSLLAMGLALDTLNKQITLYNESPIPAVYRFLPSINRVVSHIDKEDYEAAIILDCSELERVGEAAADISRIPIIINIDHHITNTHFGDYQLIDTSACATAEIVYHMIKEMNVPIDKAIATSIYTGILTDTGSFRFSNTNRAAFAICEELVSLGIDPHTIAQHVYGAYSLGRIKLLNLALDSIEISNNGKLSIMTVTQGMLKKTNTRPEDVDGFINYARSIKDVKVAALVQEHRYDKGQSNDCSNFNVSLRSDGTVDVAEIAAAYGGGGHFSAAGFKTNSALPEIKSKIVNLAEKI